MTVQMPERSTRGVVPVLAFAGITVAVMQTLLVPVIKDLPALLRTNPADATWVMTATLLAGAVSTPIAGIGLAYSSLPALIIGAVDPSETGAANGLNTLMRSIGTSVSSAVIGMVLANTSVRMGPELVPSMAGFRISFLIATGAVLIGVALAFFLPTQKRAARPRLFAARAAGNGLPDRASARVE